MNELELAWAAGFFDGEGCVTRNAGKPKPSLSIQVSQSNSPETLERFKRAVGCGNITGPYTYSGRAPRWNWQATGKNGHKVMELLLPYLSSVKRERYEQLREEVV